jgi:tetratricopeptide (TPR) repeat protein
MNQPGIRSHLLGGIRQANLGSLLLSLDPKVKRRLLFSRCSWAALVCLGIVCPSTVASCSAQDHGSTCGAQAVFKIANTELKQKRLDQAERELDQLRSCDSLSAIDTFNLGWLYGRAHNFKKALTEFNSVSPDVPDRRTHQYAIALAQFELEDYKAVIETLANNSGSQDLSRESANLLAVSYSKLGLYRESHTVLTDELHRHPDDRMSYLNLITLLGDEGEFTNAVDVADRAALTFPRDAEILVVRGATHTLVGETAKARADFKAAIKASPLYGPPRFFLAVSEYSDGNYGVACNEISQALRVGVKDPDLYYLLAEAMMRRDPNNSPKAMIELNRSVAMNPRQVQALSLRGKLRLQQHDLKDAVRDLELAHTIDPASPSATYNLARAYFALGKTEEAIALAKQLAAPGADAVSELSDQKLKSALGLQSRENR